MSAALTDTAGDGLLTYVSDPKLTWCWGINFKAILPRHTWKSHSFKIHARLIAYFAKCQIRRKNRLSQKARDETKMRHSRYRRQWNCWMITNIVFEILKLSSWPVWTLGEGIRNNILSLAYTITDISAHKYKCMISYNDCLKWHIKTYMFGTSVSA